MRRDAAVNPASARANSLAPCGEGLGWGVARPILALAVCLLPAPALAAPRSIADCEAIQEADAYNRCLASFGPMRGQRGASYPGAASQGGKTGGGKSAAARRGGGFPSGAQVTRGRGGRVRMEFTPSGR